MIQALWKFEFLQNAFMAGILIGVIAPLLGVFIVVRRQALIADALSHITLAGIAASLLLGKYSTFWQGVNPVYMGMGFSAAGSLFIEQLRKVYKHFEELAIPITLSGGIGLGVVFLSLADGFNSDLFNYLFGSVIAISRSDLMAVAIISVIVVIVVTLLYKELFFLSFDEEQAIVSGVRAKWIHFIFILLVAFVIAVSMQIVGVLLVSALMTLPVAASIRIARGFKQTIAYSIIFGEMAVLGGLVLAYYLDIAPGGTIVLLSAFILLFVLLVKRIKQWKS
ncbi:MULTISPECIES: metal ABC transporter permease [Bacillales]|jgi:zinc transport system permease protein|uniref:metal ABC transporter permease n=1 Tax=Bacillales TaxID=1385 RepID=UPI000BF68754|nr:MULTISPECIES: metal ABC transporter permease [Bacillaceae]MCA0992921.1 metal ABC transporter permease [Pseudalkalibacillus hwajinpoensis]PFG13939.1 zinc transport system permease protein [Bacillus sp. es.036]QHA92609.1 iron chelate uptake ABC transporter family permease subunit [Bacillus sp. N1-1]